MFAPPKGTRAFAPLFTDHDTRRNVAVLPTACDTRQTESRRLAGGDHTAHDRQQRILRYCIHETPAVSADPEASIETAGLV
jgi:hypothetical protein